jgi:hypothetical protein
MDPCLLQWRLYNQNIRNENLWSIKYNVYADQHRHVTKITTDSNYIWMLWMPAYITLTVPNLLIMISMVLLFTVLLYKVLPSL